MKYLPELISIAAWPVFILLALWLSNKALDIFHKRLEKDTEEEL